MTFKAFPLFFLLSSLFSPITFAQEKQGREISGYIKDTFGNSVSNATVSIQNTNFSTQADYDGFYRLQKLPDHQQVVLIISAIGFTKEIKQVNAGSPKTIFDVILKEDKQQLQEVSVVGQTENERHIQEIKRSGFNVSIIDLNKYSNEAANLTQVLKRATGLTIREDGGLGSNFVFRINGLDAKIFIDGVPMDNFGSSMSLNNIPVNLIDRIEVYKGVVPAFLGSDALGGAVNIITKRRARPFLDFSYSMGSFNTQQSALVGTFTNPKNKLSVRLNAFYNHSDNDYKMYSEEKYNVILRGEKNNKLDTIAEVKRFYDRYTSAMGQLEVGFRDKPWADQFYVGLTYSQNHKQNQLGATINTLNVGQWTESKYLMPTLSFKKSDFIVKRLFADAFTSYSYDNRHVRDTAAYNYTWSGNWVPIGDTPPRDPSHNKYNLFNYLARVNLNYDFDEERKQSINFNYNFNTSHQKEYDMINGYNRSGLPSNLARHIVGLSWQNQWFDKRLSNVMALKYYRLDATKDVDERKFNGNNELINGEIVHYQKAWNFYSMSIASRYRITSDGGWKLSYERAYNLPGMTALFGDGLNTISNFDLKPERSDNINTGFYYNTFINDNNFLNVDVTGFYRLAADYINTKVVEVNGEGYSQYYNVPGVKLYGFSAEVKYGYKDLLAITLNGSYDKAIDNKKYTDDSNQQVSLSYGYQIANRPWVYGSMDVSLIQNDWFQKGSRIQLSYLSQYTHWFYLSEAHLGSLASKDYIPSQTIHSAVLSYSWSRNKYNISFEGRNLTDERAYDNFRLQKPGRAFYLKLRLSLM
jgi:outer membrane receptor protein involved in Fe transport